LIASSEGSPTSPGQGAFPCAGVLLLCFVFVNGTHPKRFNHVTASTAHSCMRRSVKPFLFPSRLQPSRRGMFLVIMGSILDSELRQPPPPPGQPIPVGSKEARDSRTATLTQRNGDGWEYGKEVTISVWLNRLLELPSGSKVLYWSGIEIKCAKECTEGTTW